MKDETIIKIIKKIEKNKNFSPCYTFNVSKIKGVNAKKVIAYEDLVNEIFFVEFKNQIFFCVSGKVLEEVDYFDEATFLYYEEQILSKKLVTKH